MGRGPRGLIFIALPTGTWGSRCTSVFSRQRPGASVTLGVGSVVLKANPVPPIFCKVEMKSREAHSTSSTRGFGNSARAIHRPN